MSAIIKPDVAFLSNDIQKKMLFLKATTDDDNDGDKLVMPVTPVPDVVASYDGKYIKKNIISVNNQSDFDPYYVKISYKNFLRCTLCAHLEISQQPKHSKTKYVIESSLSLRKWQIVVAFNLIIFWTKFDDFEKDAEKNF